ncbi:hypothetical protein K490DRAFT_36115 [Saccharata proteae CBS 121410]|uniref:MARVEL domain-containing protein n=1 Tax=Saccharata proteae CBS 121410 TaxID=1314787 RepID=A0A9P4I0D4_9PEZI|nr:hypothetical protein K490DRAFT_36115 [Saccharata proteae CBS 121410]
MGFFLRLLGTVPYALAFCCSAIILGFYSYFLAVLSDRDRPIPTWEKAVEGLAGAAVVYTIFATVLTPCLGGKRFLAFLGVVLDVLFCGDMIAIAIMTRDAVDSCSGVVNTPLGKGNAETGDGYGQGGFGTGSGDNLTYQAKFGTACRFNKACFAVSIIGAFLFAISALLQVCLARQHKKESRIGPSPANNYTSGPAKTPFWRRRKATGSPKPADSELGTFGAGAPAAGLAPDAHVDTRPSAETAYTGSTVAPPSNSYHTGGYNPYGYDKTAGM